MAQVNGVKKTNFRVDMPDLDGIKTPDQLGILDIDFFDPSELAKRFSWKYPAYEMTEPLPWDEVAEIFTRDRRINLLIKGGLTLGFLILLYYWIN